jgi:hypothetical protein
MQQRCQHHTIFSTQRHRCCSILTNFDRTLRVSHDPITSVLIVCMVMYQIWLPIAASSCNQQKGPTVHVMQLLSITFQILPQHSLYTKYPLHQISSTSKYVNGPTCPSLPLFCPPVCDLSQLHGMVVPSCAAPFTPFQPIEVLQQDLRFPHP